MFNNYKNKMNLLSPTIKKNISVAAILTCLFFLPSTTKAYTINSVHGNLTYCDTMTRGIFIIWWDNDFNYSANANVALDSMLAFRNTCLNNLGMQDPLNAQNGYYCNIYIHTPGDTTDFFTANFPAWGNGVGGDVNGYPFMTASFKVSVIFFYLFLKGCSLRRYSVSSSESS